MSPLSSSRAAGVLIAVLLLLTFPSPLFAHAFPRIITIDEQGVRPLQIELDDDTEVVVENLTKQAVQFVWQSDKDASGAAFLHPMELEPDAEWFPETQSSNAFTYYLSAHPKQIGRLTIHRLESEPPKAASLSEGNWASLLVAWIKKLFGFASVETQK